MVQKALKCIILACLMKLCNKVVEEQFDTMDPRNFYRSNETAAFTGQHSTDMTCRFDHRVQVDSSQFSVTSWIYTARYLLPVLGGLLSSAWLGYIRVLQIGGVIMLLSTVLMSVSVYLGLMCQSSPIIPITWLLLPVFFGLTQPCLVYGMFRWHRQHKFCTIVSALYYAVYASGEWISMFVAKACATDALGNNSTLVFIALSILFITMASFFPKDSEAEPFEMPTQSRMVKYFQIFSSLVLFHISVSDTQSMMYISEMNHFLNETDYMEAHPWMSPDWLKFLFLIGLSPLLILVSYMSPQKLPVQSRILFGILLECAVETCLVILTIVGLSDRATIVTVYSVASGFDAIAELLVMVAAYDLGSGIAPTEGSMCLVMGIMFTVWGLSNFGSRLLLLILHTFPRANPVLHPNPKVKPMFYVFHLTTLVCLVICLIYNKFVALPLAARLTPEPGDEQNSEQQDDEQIPLLSHEIA